MGSNAEELARLISLCLREGSEVEIDGLGVFHPSNGGFVFRPAPGPRVFIAYVQEDAAQAEKLYKALQQHGMQPWLDRKKLIPGQNWPRAIERAIEVSDFFLACLSRRAVRKRGQFQAELRYALDCARRQPLDSIYLIPVRLEECPVPARISREFQYVDFFPDWEAGFQKVLRALRNGKAAGEPANLPHGSRQGP
ncbi:MAG: toll/interleukin-1 receptor domain-containing protein [Bryobacteraceae bacterium]